MTYLGLVGCAHIHTPGFVRNINSRSEMKVRRVWDPHPQRMGLRARELQAAMADNYQQVYDDPEISAVIICSETNRHEELALAAVAAKKHLFVEKPLGFGSRDARVMAEAIERSGVMFSTGYFQRGLPTNLFIKDQIARGSFGKITRVRGSNCHGGALGRWFDSNLSNPAEEWRWMADPKIAGVGAFGDLGTHSLDILIWWLGQVASVTSAMDYGTGAYEGCDETGEGLLKFSNGTIGTLAAAWDDVANPVTYLVSGTEGHAAVIGGQLFFQSKAVEGADGKQPWTALPPAVPAGIDAWLNSISGQAGQVLVTALEAAYRSVVMEGMYTAARTQAWVEVGQ